MGDLFKLCNKFVCGLQLPSSLKAKRPRERCHSEVPCRPQPPGKAQHLRQGLTSERRTI